MAKRVQLIRDATAGADTFTGLTGEITVDTTKKELRLHDGLTAGGIPIARSDLANVSAATVSTDGKMAAADKSKLDSVESGATADQSNAEIKTAYENNANTNAFTDAEQTKLGTVETNAAADQTGAEIKVAYEGEANTNAFTDAEQTKLAGIEAGAEVNLSLSELRNLLYPAQVTGHIRAGNKQLIDGDTTTPGFNLSISVAEATWESVGPTGSLADNIWTAMDVIPAAATILVVDILIAVSTSGASAAQNVIYATHGDIATPSISSSNNRIARFSLDFDSAQGEENQIMIRTEIPLGPTNQDFKIYWDRLNADLYTIQLFYRGFIAD